MKKKTAWFYQKTKPFGFLKNRPLYTSFYKFFIARFFVLENRSILFETCTFTNILQKLNFNQPNDVDLKNFLI
jgi:hypothetical protein